jgi:hypothetical protein
MQLFNLIILGDGLRRIFKALKMRPDLQANEPYVILYAIGNIFYMSSVIWNAEDKF